MCNTGNPATPPEFDEGAWRETCKEISREANRRCGLSHDLYVDLYSGSIDSELDSLPQTNRETALAIAREWDYATEDERQETDEWNKENGYCSHGIELGCCPAGCGSY